MTQRGICVLISLLSPQQLACQHGAMGCHHDEDASAVNGASLGCRVWDVHQITKQWRERTFTAGYQSSTS